MLVNGRQDINQQHKLIAIQFCWVEISFALENAYLESSQFLSTKTTASADGDHVTDGGPDIFPHSHNYHVPLFTLSVSILEVSLPGWMYITEFFEIVSKFKIECKNIL